MKAVDLFAGAGGFSLGLARAGFDVVLANESSTEPEWTYRFNLLNGTPEGVFPEIHANLSQSSLRLYRAKVRQLILEQRGGLASDFDSRMRGGDVREALGDKWLRKWKKRQGEIDLVVAGPPCQGFSCAGRLFPDETRNGLVDEALRVIRVLQPRVAVIENVPGMLQSHYEVVERVGLALSGIHPGYYVCVELVHGEPLGVPQTRRRLLIIGVRKDLVSPEAHARLHALLYPVACPVNRASDLSRIEDRISRGRLLPTRRILGDLSHNPPHYGRNQSPTLSYRPVPGALAADDFLREIRCPREAYLAGSVLDDTSQAVAEYANHESSVHVESVALRMRLIRESASKSEEARQNRCCSRWLRKQFLLEHPQLHTKKQAQRVLLPDDWPMLTETSLPDDIVHFEEDRVPTVREMARLQTFPDWYEFKGVRTTCSHRRRAGVFVPQYSQVANAVPPRLAHAVACRVRQFIEKMQEDPTCQFELPGGDYVSHNEKGSASERLRELNATFARTRRAGPLRPPSSRRHEANTSANRDEASDMAAFACT